MESIQNYLDGLFSKLPMTAEVQKAKEILLEMMEDKYSQLIEEGKTPNEALGTVISEFGNLDELADELGIADVVEAKTPLDAVAENVNEYKEKIQHNIDKQYAKYKKKKAKKTSGNRYLDGIMSVYWETITCAYLIWSFLTFDWFISWVIWPVAGVVFGIIKSICFGKDKEEK